MDFSKKITQDVRNLAYLMTVGGLLLAFYCVHKNFTSSLPWIATSLTAVHASLGTVVSFYHNTAKSDHSEGGITFETAKANGFATGSENSPGI